MPTRSFPAASAGRSQVWAGLFFSLLAMAATGWGGQIDTSAWFLRCSTAMPNFKAITRGHELFVAVGEGGPGTGAMMVSADGGSWLGIPNQAPLPVLRAATFGTVDDHPLYAVVGDSKTLLTSPNGLTWTKGSLPIDIYPRAASFGCLSVVLSTCQIGAYVVVGGGILSSPDGTNWTQRQPVRPQQSSDLFSRLNAVTFDGYCFIAVGGSYGSVTTTILRSTDRTN